MRKNIFVLFIASMLFVSNAYAYLDAGTGGMIIQLLFGGFAIVGMFVRIYWHKIQAFTKTCWNKIKLHVGICWYKIKLYFYRKQG